MKTKLAFACCVMAGTAYAQGLYVGASGGVGYSPIKAIGGIAPEAKTGLGHGTVVGAFIGEDSPRSQHWGGEFRYLHRWDKLELSSGGTKVSFSGYSDIVTGDFVWSFTRKGAPIRPFVSAGGGVRFFRGSGNESSVQPLGRYAALTRTWQALGVADAGAGVRVRCSKRAEVRVEVRDFASPFPNKVITLAPGGSVSGWIHDVVGMAGFSYTF